MIDEKTALANFVGATWGQVKQLDDYIVGESNSPTALQRRSNDLKRVLENVIQQPSTQSQNQPVLQNQPVIQNNVSITVPDDGQLFLDFRKRDEIYDKLDRIEEKLDLLLKLKK